MSVEQNQFPKLRRHWLQCVALNMDLDIIYSTEDPETCMAERYPVQHYGLPEQEQQPPLDVAQRAKDIALARGLAIATAGIVIGSVVLGFVEAAH
jgi:hypothetical protein